MATILDRFGRPMTAKKSDLTQEIARPGLTGVRQPWDARSAIAGLTPDRLDSILRQANQGDLDAFLTLAEEMEERDPHYGAVLQTRKLAVIGLERKASWDKGQEKDPRADDILAACQALIEAPEMEGCLTDLLDAIAKGYSAVEMIWNTSRTPWEPESYKHRDPRWFQWDRETGRELHLRQMGSIDGVELPPFSFAVHIAGRKSGLPARAGLARLVAFSFVCKLYGMKDWMTYAEIFGIPLRLGKYGPAADATDIGVLKDAVFGLGVDAAAVIPESMTIEFPELGKATGGAELYAVLAGFLDNAISKAVLGQSGTADMQKGGGYAQATILNEVRWDLTKADARSLGATVRRDILTPFVGFNWGPDAPVPRCELVVEEPEDVAVLATALSQLVPLGLRVGQAEIRAKLSVSEPADDEELLAAPARPEPPPAMQLRPTPVAAAARDGRRTALARTSGPNRQAAADAALEAAIEGELGGWEKSFGPEAAAVMDLVKRAGSFDEIRAGLDAMARDLAAPAAARSLARAMFEAHALAADENGPEA